MPKARIRISRGGKKYIRKEKARIRKMAIGEEEKKKMIADFYARIIIKK